MTGKKQYPSCFGILDIVFPKTEGGLRNSPETCFSCPLKTECLRTAMKRSDGLNAQEEVTDRAYDSGMIGFLERWSRKKTAKRKIAERKKD